MSSSIHHPNIHPSTLGLWLNSNIYARLLMRALRSLLGCVQIQGLHPLKDPSYPAEGEWVLH